MCLLLGIRGIGTAWTVLATLEQYQTLDTAGPWMLRVVFYGAWGLWFLSLAWGLWRRQRWFYQVMFPSLVIFAIFDVSWFALFAQATFDKRRLPFVIVTSTLGMGLAWWLKLRIRSQF
ncbi:MAG: hypothetical protein K8I82_22725 [Anaerolineae bacterium]|nr:hypothetical protein [Anaerolineae bacterium]